MEYGLPKSVNIGGTDFEIRYDYRVILEIIEAINDPELTDEDRAIDVLQMFYVDWDEIEDYQAALQELMVFMNGGKEDTEQKKGPKLVDWEQDFQYIVAPINRVAGQDIRGIPYDIETNTGGYHWYSVLSAYMEIGDCLFAQIVNIRSKKASGKKLDKSEKDFYKKNRTAVEIKTKYTQAEKDFFARMFGAEEIN